MELRPPQPVGDDPDTDVRIPANLDAALKVLNGDQRLVEAMGTELIEAFTILKRGEWERYMGANQETDTTEVTDWELRYYLPYH